MLRYWLGFNKTPGIGARRLQTLIDAFGSIEAAWKAPAQALSEVGLEERALQSLLSTRAQLDLDAEMARVQEAGIRLVSWDDPAYPSYLKQITSPPPLLFLKGEFMPEDEWAVAIVGTRRATTYGRECALRLSRDLSEAGITIVSGLARGIDGVAHRAALEAGGRTIAVMGNGLDTVYPPEHRELAQEIVKQGMLVSEHAPGVRPEARNFPARNRIISGLSLAVVVVEGRWSSGAVITAKLALEQGRDVFAVPGSILSHSSEGPNRLLKEGATPALNANDILEALNLTKVAQQLDARHILPTDPVEAQLMDTLSAEPLHIDELGRLMQMSAPDIASALAMLELKGMVRQVGGMQYVIARESGPVYRID
ncbi:MAG: DNA-protecting protein DprA [Chloroflexi bacterium]|nr:DNA-protecting protein DprA [Chloroflexota bacterium]